MKYIILAAGRGSRMGGLTDAAPKCMVKIWGKPLIEHCVRQLHQIDVRDSDIVVVTGYRQEVLRQALPNVRFCHNGRWESTNMVASLQACESWLNREPCAVLYSDILFSGKAVVQLRECEADIAITFNPNFRPLWELRFTNPLEDVESFRVDRDHRVVDIGRRVSDLAEVQGQFMGLLYFTPAGWQRAAGTLKALEERALAQLDMTSFLMLLIQRGETVIGIESATPWLECDHPQEVELYEKNFAYGDFL